ncbi:hypothetical protein CCR75_002170 [Bremia lactucae]|uniref:Rab3-GAP regulatory subunit N-terminal domain-containing protein n=1 Tax=Bremia lactucae TaxID=4779 RepID=A0A976FH83_BRELC|nr:hypothetical protein CCR75_002170 [Bremia lactucae]
MMASSAATSAINVALRISCGSLPISLCEPSVCVDVAEDLTILVALGRQIFIVGAQDDLEIVSQTPASLRVVVDTESVKLEDEERIAHVKWLDRELFCVGYTTGVVRIFNRLGKLVFEQKLHDVAVHRLDVNRNEATLMVPRRANVLLSNELDMEGELWVLYADSTVAIIQISEVFTKLDSVMFGPAHVSKFRKYLLREQKDIVAAMPCGPVRPTIFQSHSRLGVYTVVSTGSDPYFAFYQAGNDQNSIIHLAHIATAIVSKAAGAAWSLATSWGWRRSSGVPPLEDGHVESTQLGNNTINATAEHVPAPIGPIRSMFEDGRRRCRMLLLSPTGRLAALSDTLGRILLVDTLRMIVIRMWKGYRNAQCGWMQGIEGASRPLGLYLVIYSAQRGIVEIWRARYGPRVFSVAVGNTATLFTQFDSVTKMTKCLILRETIDKKFELIELKPELPSASILKKYFSQNKLQEENFLLHQLIGRLQALVKRKQVDATHAIEHNVAKSIFDGFSNLSSASTIQALLEVLINADMSSLNANFLLEALEKLELALEVGMASKTPTGLELSLLWKLNWQHRLVSTFIGFHAEFEHGKHALLSMIETNTKDINLLATDVGMKSSSLPRILPWLELFRRAGFACDDELCSRTHKAIDSASQLTAWEFMDFFSMPFNDPDLPRQREILSIYEVADTKEEFLRNTFRVKKFPIIRNYLNIARRDCLLTFLLAPVLSSVFAVEKLRNFHSAIFLKDEIITGLFIEWYFSLPLAAVFALPPPTMSSSLQRWLEPCFDIIDAETEINEEENDNADNAEALFGSTETHLRRLHNCPIAMVEIFNACCKTPKLFHGFVLSEHCRWGEMESAKHAEEDTLGKYSSAGSGTRWRILQDCIAKTAHLSLCLGKAGNLAIKTVEHVDEIMRNIAVMQLNDGHDPGEEEAAVCDPNIKANATSGSLDDWVATLENCQKGAQMKDWRAVLRAYPQFANKDALCCFRVETLCVAWNAKRSAMRQLEDALLELDCVASLSIKAAMATYIWERYIRIHVMTLVTFWEENAAGKKPQRGLHPKIAHQFFGIIRNLLVTLLDAVKAVRTAPALLTEHVMDEVESENDCYYGDADAESCDDNNQIEVPFTAEFTMESLTQTTKWFCQLKNLHKLFQQRWPPSHNNSALMQALQCIKLDMISITQIEDHISLMLLLDSFAATAVTPISVVKLFSYNGRYLCRPDTFLVSEILVKPIEEEANLILRDRTIFLKELLRHDDALGFALADTFGLPLEVIREEHVLFLYQSGRDERADAAIETLQRPERLVLKLGAIARARLALILRRMKTEAEYAAMMSMLPADLFTWVVSDNKPPLVADPQVEHFDLMPSLTSTHYLLLRCLAMIPPTGKEFEMVSAMSVLVKDVISQVKLRS